MNQNELTRARVKTNELILCCTSRERRDCVMTRIKKNITTGALVLSQLTRIRAEAVKKHGELERYS